MRANLVKTAKNGKHARATEMKRRPNNDFSQSLAYHGTKNSTTKMSETAGKSMLLKDELSPMGKDSRN